MKKLAKGKKHHKSDLSNDEWSAIRELLPHNDGAGRKREHDLRNVLNGIFYLLRTGCQWRNIPTYYPPWSVCRYYFDKWVHDGTLQKVNDILVSKVRVKKGRNGSPTGSIIDSQSKKTTEVGGVKGYDGFQCVKGRKRFILVDTIGNLLAVIVTAANMSEQAGARQLLNKALENLTTIKKIWADGGYQGLHDWALEKFGVDLEVVERVPGQKGFVVLPRRWVVERTFAWLCRYRRLQVDYEHHIESSVGMLLMASIRRSLRQLAA